MLSVQGRGMDGVSVCGLGALCIAYDNVTSMLISYSGQSVQMMLETYILKQILVRLWLQGVT